MLRLTSCLLPGLTAATSCARTGFEPWPCADESCAGHGTCVVEPSGEPVYACDPGYAPIGELRCLPDEGSPTISDSGRILFDTNRPGGPSGASDYDIYEATVQ